MVSISTSTKTLVATGHMLTYPRFTLWYTHAELKARSWSGIWAEYSHRMFWWLSSTLQNLTNRDLVITALFLSKILF